MPAASNTLITPSIIAKRSLMLLKNKLIMGNKVSRTYANEFVKVGDTISVRRPVEYVVTDGAALTKQDTTEGKFSLQIDKRKHVGMGFLTQDLTLTIEEFSARYIDPAITQLAHQVDSDLTGLYKKVWNWAGTPGQTINSFADFAKGPKLLDVGAVPQGKRFGALSPDDYWEMLGSQTALYMQPIASDAYRNGKLGMIGDVDTDMTQQIKLHTVGAKGGTPLVNGASQNVTYATSKDTNTQSLITDGWSNSTLVVNEGDVITIAGVFAVNPRTKVTTGALQQFVVLADGTSNGSGQLTLSIAPAIITSGAYQNVSAAPADNAAITILGTASTAYAQNLVFHKDAFQMVTVPLEVDPSMPFSARATDEQTGLSVRIVKDYDINTDEVVARLDILYGVKALRPEFATRLSGTA